MKNVPWSILAACRLSNLATRGFQQRVGQPQEQFFFSHPWSLPALLAMFSAWYNIVIVVLVVHTFLAWAISDCNRFLMVKTWIQGWPPKFPNFYRQLGCSTGSPFQVLLFCFHCQPARQVYQTKTFQPTAQWQRSMLSLCQMRGGLDWCIQQGQSP